MVRAATVRRLPSKRCAAGKSLAMKRILLVKVTSLGDVVQTHPVVADLCRAFPGVRVDWAADEAFADIIRWNPLVERVLSAPLRKFKKARNWSDLKAITASVRELRAEKYDLVLDLHGVYKSAIIAFLANARRRYGYTTKDLGERGAAFAYSARFGPRPDSGAWRGMRISVAEALGYTFVDPPNYNLHLPDCGGGLGIPADAPIAMLFHATSADEKKWPLEHWTEVGRNLVARGFRVVLPWGTAEERRAAEQIAALVPSAWVLPRLSVAECAQWIQASDLVVGLDTGLVHLAYALGRPTVMVFAATSREHFGIETSARSLSVGDQGRPPEVAEVLAALSRVLEAGAQSVEASDTLEAPASRGLAAGDLAGDGSRTIDRRHINFG